MLTKRSEYSREFCECYVSCKSERSQKCPPNMLCSLIFILFCDHFSRDIPPHSLLHPIYIRIAIVSPHYYYFAVYLVAGPSGWLRHSRIALRTTVQEDVPRQADMCWKFAQEVIVSKYWKWTRNIKFLTTGCVRLYRFAGMGSHFSSKVCELSVCHQAVLPLLGFHFNGNTKKPRCGSFWGVLCVLHRTAHDGIQHGRHIDIKIKSHHYFSRGTMLYYSHGRPCRGPRSQWHIYESERVLLPPARFKLFCFVKTKGKGRGWEHFEEGIGFGAVTTT